MNYLKDDYCDLNIPIGPQTKSVIQRAIKLGYRCLALNVPINAKQSLQNKPSAQSKKGAKKRKFEERSDGLLSASVFEAAKAIEQQAGTAGGHEVIPKPPEYPWIQEILEENPGIRILTRITIIFAQITDLVLILKEPAIKLYDVIAVVPTNHDAIQSCLVSTSVIFDIISFDFEGSHWINKIRLNRQKGNLAIEKEIYFEVTYSASLRGDLPLENMIYTGKCLTEDIFPKRIKNIILTSGAGTERELRSPKDLTHIGYLLGLGESLSLVSFRDHQHRILYKSDSRKFGKTWVAFIPTSKLQSKSQQKKSATTTTTATTTTGAGFEKKEMSVVETVGESIDSIKNYISTSKDPDDEMRDSSAKKRKKKGKKA